MGWFRDLFVSDKSMEESTFEGFLKENIEEVETILEQYKYLLNQVLLKKSKNNTDALETDIQSVITATEKYLKIKRNLLARQENTVKES